MNIESFCKAVRALEKANIPAPYYAVMEPFVDCPKPTPINVNMAPTPCTGYETQECEVNKPKETTMRMCINDCGEDFSAEANSLSYLGERTYSIYINKRTDLQKQYGLIDDNPPKTTREFLERIASGKYQIDADKMDKQNYGDYIRFINWRDPEMKKDQGGFDVAEKKLTEAKTKAEDTLTLFTTDPAKQLAALQAFESTTIQ